MKHFLILLSVALLLGACQQQDSEQASSAIAELAAKKAAEKAEAEKPQLDPEDTRMIKDIFEHCLTRGETYGLLEFLSKNIGHRLSGSEGAAKAVAWTQRVMETYRFDQVYLQDVKVPHWVRGDKEVCQILGHPESELNVLALGGSVATPAEGLIGEVIEVKSLEEVAELGDRVKGRIVFYNRPFNQASIYTGSGYGGAVDQRSKGPSMAAKYGAIACVVRSVSSAFDDKPHTGTLSYTDSLPKIPAAALGVISADRLSAALAKNPGLLLSLRMNCATLPDENSANVVGELRGRELPNQVIVVGGHLDSWDVGDGSHDDGAGCMQAIQVLRTFQELGIQPRHTIRAVMFMNEENGTRGGKRYAEMAGINGEDHILAIESDAGGFSPRGFGLTAPDSSLEKWRSWLPHFDPHTISYISKGGGGTDIGPLNRSYGTPTAGLRTDAQRLFDVHHSANDTFESVNRRELELGTAAMAAYIYLVDKYGM